MSDYENTIDSHLEMEYELRFEIPDEEDLDRYEYFDDDPEDR